MYVLENDTYSLVAGENALLLTSLNNCAYTLPMIERDGIPAVYADKTRIEKKREEEDIVHDVISAYMECENLAPMEELNENAIARAISALLDTFTKDDIVSAIRKANATPFLTGKSNTGFPTVNLAWILKPERLAKILNGEYDDFSTTTGESDKSKIRF